MFTWKISQDILAITSLMSLVEKVNKANSLWWRVETAANWSSWHIDFMLLSLSCIPLPIPLVIPPRYYILRYNTFSKFRTHANRLILHSVLLRHLFLRFVARARNHAMNQSDYQIQISPNKLFPNFITLNCNIFYCRLALWVL